MRRLLTAGDHMDTRPRDKRFFVRDRRGIFLRWAAACVWAAGLIVVSPLQAARFTASLDHEMITLGESATLSLTFEGGAPKAVPAVPAIAGLQINYAGPSSQFSIINGQVSSIVTHVFTVTPAQPGTFTIPALAADIEGLRLSTQPLKLAVLKPAAPSPETITSGSQPAFLKLTLPKKEVYLGEIITGELQLYVRDGVGLRQFQLTATPVEGFTLGKLVELQHRRTQIGNAAFSVVPISLALTAVKNGPLTVGPITANTVIELPSANRRRDPFLDPFGMFESGERRQLPLATEAVRAQSLPLPDKSPADFNGAVGSYTMTATAGPLNVATGDPITVRVQIAGRGALDALNLPGLAAWNNFKSYPPTSKIETTDQLGLQGTKSFEQVVTPESSDLKELPALSFSFFDPDAKQYRTLTQPAVPLIVRPGGVTPAPVVAATSRFATDAPPPRQDIVHIKPRPGALARIGPPLIQQPWFITLQSAPVLAWLAAVGWRRRADSLANNPRLRRQRKVAQVIRTGLGELRRHAAANQSEEFFATLFRLLQEQLGERLDCPASAITEAVLEEKLRPRGVADRTLTELHELFQTCNQARYAPVTSGQELAALVPRFESVLCDLQNLKP
jgi:hypothetical protein